MMYITKLDHSFVRNIPRELVEGMLYISMEYGTAVHSCCCGCGEQIVTPFTPTDWKLIYDGQSISLTPSIGNWNLACRSHYIIKQGRVIEAGNWSNNQISAEQKRDKAAKENFYNHEKIVADNISHGEEFTTIDTHVSKIKRVWELMNTWFSDNRKN